MVKKLIRSQNLQWPTSLAIPDKKDFFERKKMCCLKCTGGKRLNKVDPICFTSICPPSDVTKLFCQAQDCFNENYTSKPL